MTIRNWLPNKSLQPTVNPLRGVPAAELQRVRGRCAPANGARVSNIGALGAQRPRTPRSSGHRYAALPA